MFGRNTETAMHIAIICTDFYPLRSSAAVQLEDLALALIQEGFSPTILVPTGQLSRLNIIRHYKGICIIGLPSFPIKETNYIFRTIGELLLPITMGLGLVFCTKVSIKNFRGIICYSPSIFFGPLIFALKTLSKCRVYLIVRDIFPEWALDLGLVSDGIVYRALKFFAWVQYCSADIIGVQSNSNLAYIPSKIPGVKQVLHNWLAPHVGHESFCSIDFNKTSIKGRQIFVYAGNMGIAQNPGVLVDIALSVRDDPTIGFALIGRGSELNGIRDRVARLELKNIVIFDEIPSNEIEGLYAQSHVGLISLDLRHSTHNIPGKFLSYIRSGLPVFAFIGPSSDLAKIIISYKVGIVCADISPKILALNIQGILDKNNHKEMQLRALELSQSVFSSKIAAKQIINALEILE